MRKRTMMAAAAAVACALGMMAGCRKNAVDATAFQSALNTYYAGKPECVWAQPVKLPAQADTSKDADTQGFDALTDAGMLTRKTAEKSRFLVGSKQVNDYDLSDKGRTAWKPDAAQPGYGNFCFGHLAVTSIDGYTPKTSDAAQYTVSYHYTVNGAPDWASTGEMQTAFPRLADDEAGGRTATATLMKSGDGWQVANVQPTATTLPSM